MTPARVAPPLPECPGCGDPVRRAAFLENGGTCTPCKVARQHARGAHPSQLELEAGQ